MRAEYQLHASLKEIAIHGCKAAPGKQTMVTAAGPRGNIVRASNPLGAVLTGSTGNAAPPSFPPLIFGRLGVGYGQGDLKSVAAVGKIRSKSKETWVLDLPFVPTFDVKKVFGSV